MPGNRTGGLKTAALNKAKDPDFYVKIGMMGQEAWAKNGRKPRGFSAMDREKVSAAGKKGGAAKRRNKREPKN